MKTHEEIKKGLECCNKGNCKECPYRESEHIDCQDQMNKDALAYIEQLEEREWDMFDLLSSVWFSKQYYFKQDDGTVYSRQSCQYLTFGQAIDEFAYELTGQRADAQDVLPEFKNGVRIECKAKPITCGECEYYGKSPMGSTLGWCRLDCKHRSPGFWCANADRRANK